MTTRTTFYKAADDTGRVTGVLSRPPSDTGSLVVLFHGGGTDARYFDNSLYSVVKDFTSLGYNVLNVNRMGYGGNPTPATEHPLTDTVSVYATLIEKTWSTINEQANGGIQEDRGGIVLVGHSSGGFVALGTAHELQHRLPIRGVSVLGAVATTRDPSEAITEILQSSRGRERIEVSDLNDTERIKLLGPPGSMKGIDINTLAQCFQPVLRDELAQVYSQEFNRHVLDVSAPLFPLPLQFLAAEYDLHWLSMDAAVPIFDECVGRFQKTNYIDAGILRGGGHNFEMSANAHELRERRIKFVSAVLS